MKSFFLILIITFAANSASAQLEESIVVTGSRVSVTVPGTVLKRSGDFLLLPVTVLNDSREEEQREDEIYKTLARMLNEAKRDGELEVSVLVDQSFVRPLTKKNYKIKLSKGDRRPDTSRATIHVSTRLTKASKPGAQIDKLKSFVEGIAVVGRTELITEDEVEVSIVDPNQYRGEIVGLVARDIKRVTGELGEGYRIHLRGIDRQVRWVRSGLSEVTLYIPYTYDVLPAANAYFINNGGYE